MRGKLKLVIEIDGESHEGRFSYDMQRQQFLESMGLTVIRFNDADVKVDMKNNVLMAIEGWIERNNPLPPFSKGELPTHFEKEPIYLIFMLLFYINRCKKKQAFYIHLKPVRIRKY